MCELSELIKISINWLTEIFIQWLSFKKNLYFMFPLIELLFLHVFISWINKNSVDIYIELKHKTFQFNQLYKILKHFTFEKNFNRCHTAAKLKRINKKFIIITWVVLNCIYWRIEIRSYPDWRGSKEYTLPVPLNYKILIC